MVVMTLFLGAAGLSDRMYHKIPNLLSGLMFVCLVIETYLSGSVENVAWVMLRVIIAFIVLFPLYAIGVIGAGDVKILMICSGYQPFSRYLYFLFFSMLFGAVEGTIKMIRSRQLRQRIDRLIIYVKKFLATGIPEKYHCNREAEENAGVAMAGHMFMSALLGLSGVY